MNLPIEVRVAGHTYRVTSSASETEVLRLAEDLDARIRAATAPGRQISPNALLLVALSLLHELETESTARRQLESRSKEMLRSMLARIDGVLEADAAAPAEAGAGAAAAPPPE